jgi:hypothetical protein
MSQNQQVNYYSDNLGVAESCCTSHQCARVFQEAKYTWASSGETECELKKKKKPTWPCDFIPACSDHIRGRVFKYECYIQKGQG